MLQSRLSAVEEEKVAAQKAHHDLQLQMRKGTSHLEHGAHVSHMKEGVPILQIVESLGDAGKGQRAGAAAPSHSV